MARQTAIPPFGSPARLARLVVQSQLLSIPISSSISPQKNFLRSGLAPFIVQLQEDAGLMLSHQGDATFDMIFLDSERLEYPSFWPDIKRVLRPGGLLIADNAITHPGEIAPFIALVKADAEFITCLVPVGNGEFMATRIRQLGNLQELGEEVINYE